MKKRFLFILFCFCLLATITAQPVHQIKGTVIDKTSRKPLEFINVMIVGLNKGGVTNAEGKFSIGQVPPGHLSPASVRYRIQNCHYPRIHTFDQRPTYTNRDGRESDGTGRSDRHRLPFPSGH